MVGNGSTTTLTLSSTPASVNDVAIYLDGIFQRPTNEYTLSGSTITFTTAPANNVFVCALVGGGEHIGSPMANSISTEKLADGTITNADIDSVSTSKVSGTLPALNANAVTGLNAANLVGSAMPAIDGSNLTGLSSFTKNANDPATNTNGTLGDIWANTTSGELFVLTDATTNDNVWRNVGDGTGDVAPTWSATGGTITTNGDYKVHSFTTSGSFNFNVTSVGTIPTVEYLVIAGGAAGGGRDGTGKGGGGGAGGYRTATGFSVSAQQYTVVVGAGGSGVTAGFGTDGSNSEFSTITSIGGGGGGYYNAFDGRPGGSGGGGGDTGTGTSSVGGDGTVGQGFAGGAASSNGASAGGGGGGASAVGADNPTAGTGGAGGNGLASDILVTGQDVLRAGGGGGSGSTAGTGGAVGGTGGGGRGQTRFDNDAGTGTVNSGSGGGGTGESSGTSGSGGSGIVILRYKYQ
jgi:hypothetical protein